MSVRAIDARARRALLDALDALRDHRDALVLVGAHAIYLYTGQTDVPVATRTKDADLALVPSLLRTDPQLEVAMAAAYFKHNPKEHQPGEWISPDGYPVELLVPKSLHAGGGRRGARIPPHSTHAARAVVGLEAAVVDNAWRDVRSLEPSDKRVIPIRVASAAALVVAKLHKLGDRHDSSPNRLEDKDAHDLYRLLRAMTDVGSLADSLGRLQSDPVAGSVTRQAVAWMRSLCATPESPIPVMAGRAEQLVGMPEEVAAATWALAQDLLDRLRD